MSAQKAKPLAPGKGAKVSGSFAPAVPSKVSHQPAPAKEIRKRVKTKPRKKRKSLFQKVLSEAFDVIEDIFD